MFQTRIPMFSSHGPFNYNSPLPRNFFVIEESIIRFRYIFSEIFYKITAFRQFGKFLFGNLAFFYSVIWRIRIFAKCIRRRHKQIPPFAIATVGKTTNYSTVMPNEVRHLISNNSDFLFHQFNYSIRLCWHCNGNCCP